MEYTIILTQQPNKWQASIVGLPEGVVEAPIRAKALEDIQSLAVDLFSRSEMLKLELPISATTTSENALNLAGFGAFKDDPMLGPLFDDIEQRRDEHIVGD